MNMQKKIRRFFTWNRHANGGFTLVELVVVIAILAILAGVAIPVYSGYVEKANIAADQELLGAVNTAFAAACVDNGTDQFDVPGQPKLNRTAANTVASVTVFNDAFQKYYADNEDAKFKTDIAVVYDGLKGAFVLFTDGTVVFMKYGDDLVPVSAEYVNALAESTFINASGLGVDGLMTQVDFVADVAASIGDGMYAGIINNPEFKKAFLKNLGVEGVDDLNTFNLNKKFNAVLTEKRAELLSKDPTLTDDEAGNKVTANMAVLFAAQSTKDLTDAQINELLMNADPKTMIKGNDKDGNKLAQAALYYGMYVSYAHSSQGNASLIEKTQNPVNFFASDVLASEGFKNYVNSAEGKADLEAYRASMNIIVDGVNNSDDAVGNLVVNGFTDQELRDLMKQALGQ